MTDKKYFKFYFNLKYNEKKWMKYVLKNKNFMHPKKSDSQESCYTLVTSILRHNCLLLLLLLLLLIVVALLLFNFLKKIFISSS